MRCVSLVSLVLVLAAGCGSQAESNSTPGSGPGDDIPGDDSSGSGSGNGGGNGGGGNAGGGDTNAPSPGGQSGGDLTPIDSGDLIVVPPPPVGGSDAGTGYMPGGSEDLCDGIDNDGNGIIDDVDVGRDGICDCLMIATLGKPGKWGQGDVFATWLDSRSASGATKLADSVLTPELLAPFHVVVIEDVSVIGRTYEPSEVEALRDWVAAGGGLMTLIGYADPDERLNVNTLLAPFELQYGAQQIAQRRGGSTLPIGVWMEHPITDGVDLVGSDNGYPVEGSDSSSMLIAETDKGDPMGRARPVGSGHVFVWGDEWITYNSEWLEHEDYQVELFWVNSIKWLTVADQCQVPVPATIPRAPR